MYEIMILLDAIKILHSEDSFHLKLHMNEDGSLANIMVVGGFTACHVFALIER